MLALVAVIALGGILAWVVVRGFPQREGTAQLSGLSASVKVVRDQNGLVNIYASTPTDLFAAQGWVHASERMWQMEVWRHIGAGRLAELFGESMLDTDKFTRTLGWRQAAQRDLAALPAETRKILDAYSSGVNAWLDTHADLPLPFVITGLLGAGGGLSGYKPEPWTALDTVTWQKVQAWSLGSNWDSELFRLIARGRGLSGEQLAELFPAYSDNKPTVVPAAAHGTGVSSPAAMTSQAPLAADLGRLLAVGDNLAASVGLASGGSNAFAVSPDMSASGHALLANDPHLGISMPSLWFIVGLHCRPVSDACPYDMAGAGFPGVPGIVLGHNNRIAWGLTNVGPDVQDLYAETLDPATPDHYMYKGESQAMEVRTETIKVKGADAVELRVRETVHGPVISDVAADLRPKADGGKQLGVAGKAYALEWAAINQPDLTVQAVLGVSRAQNWEAFRDALRDFGAPSQTYMYADVDGNIGVQVPGKMPIRAQGNGSEPVPGDSGDYDWTGYVPFDDLPFAYNPKEGLLEASNNLPSRQGPFLGAEFDPGYRAERVTSMLNPARTTSPLLTTEGLRAIQKDVTLTRAAPIIAAISDLQPETADGKQVLAKINAWADDPQCTTASAGCAAYETFEYRFERATFDDELGSGDEPDDVAPRYVGTEIAHETLIRLVADRHSAWFDNVTTSAKTESFDDVAVAALDAAGADLRKSIGDPSTWTWGAIHTITFAEQSLGNSGVAPIELTFNKGPYPAPGSCTTINKICGEIGNANPPAGEPADLKAVFAAVSSPSYRLVIDMGDLDGATIIQTTGQSGLPFDGHYGDFIGPWLDNLPVHLLWSDSSVNGAARQTLTLNP